MAKNKKQNAPTQTETQEACPRCNSTKYSVEKAGAHKRYCQVCGHVWLPLTKDALELQAIRNDMAKLEGENFRLKEHIEVLNDLLAQAKEYIQLSEQNAPQSDWEKLCKKIEETAGKKKEPEAKIFS